MSRLTSTRRHNVAMHSREPVITLKPFMFGHRYHSSSSTLDHNLDVNSCNTIRCSIWGIDRRFITPTFSYGPFYTIRFFGAYPNVIKHLIDKNQKYLLIISLDAKDSRHHRSRLLSMRSRSLDCAKNQFAVWLNCWCEESNCMPKDLRNWPILPLSPPTFRLSNLHSLALRY